MKLINHIVKVKITQSQYIVAYLGLELEQLQIYIENKSKAPPTLTVDLQKIMQGNIIANILKWIENEIDKEFGDKAFEKILNIIDKFGNLRKIKVVEMLKTIFEKKFL